MKTWFLNLKISKKLLIGFLLISFLGTVTGLVGIMNLIKITDNQQKTYDQCTLGIEYAYDAQTDFLDIRISVRDIYIYYNSDKTRYYNEISAKFDSLDQLIGSYEGTIINSEDQNNFDAMKKAYEVYKKDVNEIVESAEAGQAAPVILNMIENAGGNAKTAADAFETIVDYKDSLANKRLADDLALSWKIVYIMVGISAGSLLFALFLAFYISGIISKPMQKFAAFAELLAVGDINVENIIDEKDKLLHLRKDEVGVLAGSFDKIIASTMEQAEKAGEIASGDLTTVIMVRSENDVLGKALSELAERFHNLVALIIESANEVDSGAKLVANSSTSLSQGAAEQASSVEQLTASLEEVSSQVNINAQNAQTANELTKHIKEDAESGDDKMADMLRAIDEINVSSDNIRKIIKVIEDIAFQTNILALNAAVEAARAGQYGKGFAVVAEEVRSLAAQSAKAAKETTDLIEGSIKKIEVGTKIANETAGSLNSIVSEISKATDLVDAISAASNEQAAALEQINQGIIQVSQVVQSNAAVSEESAASSEELSSQADSLKESVSVFKI